jgi:hypothetical protein
MCMVSQVAFWLQLAQWKDYENSEYTGNRNENFGNIKKLIKKQQ